MVEQFLPHCRHLKELQVYGFDSNESYKENMRDLAFRIMDAQAENKMETLALMNLAGSYSDSDGLKETDMLLINSIVRSGQTNLIKIDLFKSRSWWADSEALSYLCAFIQEQNNLKELVLRHNFFSNDAFEQVI